MKVSESGGIDFNELLFLGLIWISAFYVAGLMIVWLIIVMDKELDVFQNLKAIERRTDANAISSDLEVLDFQHIDLKGQEHDDEIIIVETTKQIKPIIKKKSISKNQLYVQELKLDAVHNHSKQLGLSILDDEARTRTQLCKYLDGIELDNIRRLYSEGEHDQLEQFAKARMRVRSDEQVVRVILIRSLFRNKKFADCITECESLLKIEKKHLDAHRFIARSHRALGNDDDAIVRYQRIAKISWEDIDCRYALMKYHWNRRQYDIAHSYIDELLKLSPDEIRYHVYSGRIHARLHQHEQACERWNILLALDPDNIDALLGIGRSMYALEDSAMALKYLLMANEIEPTDSRISKSLVQVYTRIGLLNNALEILENECIESPLSKSIWEKRFSLTFRMFGDESGDGLVDEILEKNDFSIEGYVLAIVISNTFLLKNREEELASNAISEFNDVFKLNIDIATAFNETDNIGKTFFYLNKAFEEVEEDPSNHPIMKQISAFLSELNKDEGIFIGENGEFKELLKTELIIEEIIHRCRNRVNPTWSWNRKVAMISSTLGMGGSERQVVACLRGLVTAKQWADVRLFCNKIDTTGGRYETFESVVQEFGVPIHEFGLFDRTQVSLMDEADNDVHRLINLLPNNMANSITALAVEFQKYRPALVHAWQDGMNIISALAALIAGVPSIVMFARSLRPDQKTIMHTYGKRYLRYAYRSLLNLPQTILVHNSKAGVSSYSEWLEIEGDEFEVIYNGVDFEKVIVPVPKNIQAIIEEIDLPNEALVVGSVFRLVDEKRPRLWVETAAAVIEQMDDIHFVLVGGGQLLEIIKQEVSKAGLSERIHLVGQSSDVAAWLDRFDLFLLTSRVEGLPNVLIEAQAMSVPVISTDAGGAFETFIDGQTGHLCLEPTKSVLADMIISTLRDEVWMENAVIQSKKVAREKFSQEQMISSLLEIYDKVIN